ncbi:putative esterase C31F10.02 [Schizosaccharomyces pombe]|uniref:Putative esterase C31F10.02 n=1 Tax=Schizosaccharomyces pombe (strain 972 / ATCC 24843) TaxID=284812 RepID=YB22_SCHPO|nr:putative acyl-CoA thioesterase [Schizosaccharomyces pombe]P87304.1 RecName: Full=Putative esterase C31F10.02 [Schizosaccharomyces pombe 972h-]CAB10079.1 acyl-CoA thioesterase (predicted) [Schizosaccharomyces pombe]|eukprot:NP_596564.1 putative acyl-CoA thioesterase [Schizosaccharomyces pombe]
MAINSSGTKVLSFVRSVWQDFVNTNGFDAHVVSDIQIISAVPGFVECSLKLQKHHLNRMGNLHGGCIAALTDLGGSLALASRGLFISGVSIDMNQTFLQSGGTLGSSILLHAKCDRLGSNIAFTSVDFLTSSNEVFAKGRHTKFVRNALGDPRNCLDLAED